MMFKVNKIAAAVAVSLGTSVVGMNAAQADEILFPYVVTSSTVTTLVSTMNNAGTFTGDAAPTALHYRYWYKNGGNAESNSATCQEVNKPLPSSANDIVTFDVGGSVQGDNLGILYEDVGVATLPEGNARGYGNATFSLLAGLTQPVRAFLVVDNNDFTSNETYFRTSESLAGEAIILEFVNGAAWGYSAYNASGRYDNNGVRYNNYDFSDYVETAGEVIANDSGVGYVPVAIAPRFTDSGADDVITKFFVTPIAPSRYSSYDSAWVPPGGTYRYLSDGSVKSVTLPTQLRGDLTANVQLGAFDVNLGQVVMYDRDEGPVSGRVPQTVTCVGAVDFHSMLSEGALNQVPEGGWSNLAVSQWSKDGTSHLPSSTLLTDEAVVIKLEYNTATSPSVATTGIINNAIWLRKGIRESVAAVSSGVPRITLFDKDGDINSPGSSAQ